MTEVLMAIGGGTGPSIAGTGSTSLDRALLRRLHYQDKAVLMLFFVAYLVSILLLLNVTYRQSSNTSAVTYYGDPRISTAVMEGHDLDAFLDAFNDAPGAVKLQVTGFVPIPDGVLATGVQWNGEFYHVAFTFSLDLTPWVVWDNDPEDLRGPGENSSSFGRQLLEDGMTNDDIDKLKHFLAHDKNDLAFVEVVKEVSWTGWEELATNIKQQIRQKGFNGIITIHPPEQELLGIYKNRAWANFMHSRMTRALCVLSVVGWLVYVPYLWLRCCKITVKSRHKVDVTIANYWPLIADKLRADGFESGAANTNGLPRR